MSGKSVMNKFVLRNIAQRLVHCMYVCVFYLILVCMLDTAGIGADKMPQEDISVVTEVDGLSPDGSSSAPTEGKGLLSSDIGFVHAFAASFMVIIVSELGDKTFFIAAIMAMRHPRLTVFAGAIAALALMTVLSVLFGIAATIIPRVYTFYISTALFALFGLKMLYDGYHMSATGAAEELEEVQSDLRKREDELEREANAGGSLMSQDAESGASTSGRRGTGRGRNSNNSALKLLLRIFMQAFTMTFVAEWGDRSQLTTVILSARENVYGVIAGGIIGHSICTGLAVIGGRMIAQRISVRTVTLIGGVVFLLFALSALIFGPGEEEPVKVPIT
ncbi:transmembrane protein 165 isoform X2 [Anopheles merus]|uniref:GDT1 family protein n=2 Tax=gambiae species complex TaxID=44542 RepID=A0A1S4H8Y5_ANOGA|nr:transmembrane protein 165 isoform X2 [Anopheles merus]XP_049466294.1 transmembrane protein 165 isoform X2 [Anopheles coluzzii]XP_061518537.1 putative divalent cation/proton antiporter TMEM165 isoform X2 [Anopheles gambiae]